MSETVTINPVTNPNTRLKLVRASHPLSTRRKTAGGEVRSVRNLRYVDRVQQTCGGEPIERKKYI